jgi:hypothetical protein
VIPLSLLPWRKIIPALALLAAVGAGIGWHVHRVDTARAEGRAAGADEVRAEVEKKARIATEQARAEDQRRITAIREVADNAARLAEERRVAALDADRAAVSLRDRIAALAAKCSRPASGAGVAASGPSAPDAGRMLAELSGRLEAAGRELAAIADARGAAGSACERAYGALTR